MILNIILAGFFIQYAEDNPDLRANEGRECYAAEYSYIALDNDDQ